MPAHLAALRELGPCPIHRRSFEPIKSMTGWSRDSRKATASKTRGGAGGRGRGAKGAKELVVEVVGEMEDVMGGR